MFVRQAVLEELKQTQGRKDTIAFYILDRRVLTAGRRTNFFGPRIITVISVITIGLPCVPKILNKSGNSMAVRKFAQM